MKTIIVRDEVYERLKELKGENLSFSDVIEKLLKERKEKSLLVFEKKEIQGEKI